MDKGSIHIYCGEGKGKTTAAIGQGIQEASQGRSVIIIQFMKERNAEAIGFVQRLEPEIKLFRFQKRSKISKMHSILQEKYWSRKNVMC